MPTIIQAQRRKHIRAAEGYLDLATALDDRWPLDDSSRKTLADRALAHLEKIKNPMGHKPYILFLKGQACRIDRQYTKAIHYLDQSAKTDPDNLHTHLALAWCFKRTDRLEMAIESMKRAVELDPESAICHYNLACYCALNQQVNLALVHLSFALDLSPEYRDKIASESDFDLIRDNPRFISVTSVVV